MYVRTHTCIGHLIVAYVRYKFDVEMWFNNGCNVQVLGKSAAGEFVEGLKRNVHLACPLIRLISCKVPHFSVSFVVFYITRISLASLYAYHK